MINCIQNDLTILVNSCDAYSDLWDAFFKLFSKYGGELTKCNIILNADSKKYNYDGLNIICPNNYSTPQQWGARVKNCLKYVKTDYVFMLLDDFFLQRPCDIEVISNCICWLKANKNIGAFNLLSLKQSEDESNLFKGFCYINTNVDYRLNSQACVWDKNVLDQSILDIESPWDWEIFGNKRNAILLKDKDFYCISETVDEPYFYNSEFCNKKYSPDLVRNAVIRGKWDLSCIEDCFKENDIHIDYSARGLWTPNKKPTKISLLLGKINKLIHLRTTLKNRKASKLEYARNYKKFVLDYIGNTNTN